MGDAIGAGGVKSNGAPVSIGTGLAPIGSEIDMGMSFGGRAAPFGSGNVATGGTAGSAVGPSPEIPSMMRGSRIRVSLLGLEGEADSAETSISGGMTGRGRGGTSCPSAHSVPRRHTPRIAPTVMFLRFITTRSPVAANVWPMTVRYS